MQIKPGKTFIINTLNPNVMKKNLLLISMLSLLTLLVHAQTPGNSLHFDGTNDYITMPLPPLFSNLTSNDFTVEVWIKPQGSTFARVLFAQFSTSSFFSLTISATRQIYFYLNNTLGPVTTTTLPLGQWTHVACTWKASTQEANIYFNGVLQTTSSGGSSSTGTNNLMSIGGRTDGNQYFNGELDELRIWSVARKQCELDLSINTEFTVTQPNLVAYYKFNQGTAGGTNTSVNTLTDFTSNYNGTLNNFALTGTNSNWLASGAVINQVNVSTTLIATDVITACDSYMWRDGVTYTSSNNTATFTVVSPLGCDSLITLDLTINNSTTSTDIQTGCNSFTWINGVTYTASNNTAQHISTNAAGCDSIITLDLTIKSVDVSVTVNDPVITANESGATYRWLDCNNSFAVVPGATSQAFTATANGVYAVEVTKDGCSDTSMCITISTVGISNNDPFATISIFPNPNQGVVNIGLGELKDVSIKVFNISGMVLHSASNINSSTYQFEFNKTPGIYIIDLISDGRHYHYSLVKE
jgi:hypothetical protein